MKYQKMIPVTRVVPVKKIAKQLERYTNAPFWNRGGFADRFQERRDEIWFGITYQF